ncbi:hypothetical protein [Galbibacter pacificus]|uniref:Uncharacterized protein n=1 Tax=Galbibacter pacificus TaxID=2996052 RepID=A0ABT6FQE2_9FLAO|nr:hypothetical protein [Galbibacter pacificus]MDG3582042.1 hypothetical protein [Galbibacter pacificus]MDG3585484.1 hypothetical protein [Galbibacter pacificus]
MKQTLTIPTSLKDITLKSYQRFLDVAEDSDEQFIREKMIQIFCGVELLHIQHIPSKDFIEITDGITTVLSETPELKQTFKLDGITYGFIPNLDKMSLGEFIDLDTHIGNWQKMHIAMSVLYRPITEKKGEKYRIEAYEGEPNEAFKKMPLDIVIGSMLFFWTIGNDLLNYIKNYLPRVAREQQKKVQETLIANGVGTSQLTHSVEGITSELRQSLNRTFIPPSIIYATSKIKPKQN